MNNKETIPNNQQEFIKGDILIVDDILPNLRLLSTMLIEDGYKVRGVSNGSMALTVVKSAPPDLILLDINMPNMDGYQVCQHLKANQQTCGIPVIFISALDRAIDKVKAFSVGGVDYITKPFQIEEVLARVKNHLTIQKLQLKLQQANDDLEKRVEERTAELLKAITVLEEQVTRRQQAEKEKIELTKQLQQSQKMEALGKLAGGITHDFNNLISVVIGYSELALHRQLSEDDPLRLTIEQIKKAAEQAASLTKQLLAFSRKQVIQPRVLDLKAVVSNTEKILQRLIGEDIELMTMFDPELSTVKADPAQIEQVIINLVVNARDAMPHGGKLTIELANTKIKQKNANRYFDMPPGPYVRFRINDTGIGIHPEIQPRIFEPFFTTKPPGQGTGLGLATVHGIVKQSNGHIFVDSQPEQGTTFEIYLPVFHGLPEHSYQQTTPITIKQGTETILLVEDETQVRIMIRKLLEWYGYVVLEAADGNEAILQCEQYPEPIDLLITDVVMPQMSGRELAERLVLLRPQIKILYTSGYAGDSIVYHGIIESDMAFLQKPFTQNQLIQKVQQVLNYPHTNTIAT